MAAWIALPREAWSQWCTNPLLLRQRRSFPYWAVAAALASIPLFRLLGLTQQTGRALLKLCGVDPWNSPGNRLMEFWIRVVDPYFVVAAVLIGWLYARTFLRSPEVQSLPLSPRQRTAAILVPAAILLALPIALNAVRLQIAFVAAPGYPHRELLAALYSLSALPGLAIRPLRYLTIGLAWRLPRDRGRLIVGAVLLSYVIPRMESLIWKALLRTTGSWGISQEYLGHAAVALQIAVGYPLAVVELCLLAILLRHAARVAEATLFTPDAVERWEAGRR